MTALEGRQVGCPLHAGRACRVPVGATTAALLPVFVYATLLLWLKVRGGKERVGVYVLACVCCTVRTHAGMIWSTDPLLSTWACLPPRPPSRAHTHSLTGAANDLPVSINAPRHKCQSLARKSQSLARAS